MFNKCLGYLTASSPDRLHRQDFNSGQGQASICVEQLLLCILLLWVYHGPPHLPRISSSEQGQAVGHSSHRRLEGLPHAQLWQSPFLNQGFYCQQFGEERVYEAYTSALLFIPEGSQVRSSNRAGTWRQKPMQRPWRGAAYWLAFCRTQDQQSREGPTHGGLGPSPWITMRKCLTSVSHEGISSMESLPSLMTLPCVQLTHKTSQYSP